MFDRAFTVDEANEELAAAHTAIRRVRAGAAAARRAADRIAVLGVLWGNAVREEGHPDHEEYRSHRRRLERLRRRIERSVRTRLTDRGIRFPPGGLEHGLLDFPSTLDGRWILLCWQLGEERVAFWHELDGGYAGRRPITPAEAARIGR